MGKTGKERQREYIARLKEKDNKLYLEKERIRKKERLQNLKSMKSKYNQFKAKDGNRKSLEVVSGSDPNTSFGSVQSFGRAIA